MLSSSVANRKKQRYILLTVSCQSTLCLDSDSQADDFLYVQVVYRYNCRKIWWVVFTWSS